MNKAPFALGTVALSHNAALFSGVVALKLSVVKHAKDHLQDAACRAPTMKTRAVLEALVEAQANIEKSLSAFLEACKEMEAAPHINPKKEEPKK
jgi:hypothetical protein